MLRTNKQDTYTCTSKTSIYFTKCFIDREHHSEGVSRTKPWYIAGVICLFVIMNMYIYYDSMNIYNATHNIIETINCEFVFFFPEKQLNISLIVLPGGLHAVLIRSALSAMQIYELTVTRLGWIQTIFADAQGERWNMRHR